MKVFVAGATGAIGRQLAPMLVKRGHEVVATTRTPEKAAALRAMGAEPVVADALDREAVVDAVVRAAPEAVVHQATALTGVFNLKHFLRSSSRRTGSGRSGPITSWRGPGRPPPVGSSPRATLAGPTRAKVRP